MLKAVKLIYNPSSGECSVIDQLDKIINLYQNKGYSLSPYRLNFTANQKTHLCDDLRENSYHHILIAGGDGTINYIVNILKTLELDTPIALLPSGTANDFATHLGMGEDIMAACKKILQGEIKQIDLAQVNNKYFVNVFSCGLLSEVSQKTPTILKNNLGKIAYYVGGLGELTKIRKMNIELTSDNGNYSGSSLLFFVFNGQTAGNMKLAYLSDSEDGLLDVLIIKGDNPFETIEAVVAYLPNLWRKKYSSGIVHIQCKSLEIKCLTKEKTDIDGQRGPDFPLNIECIKGGLKIILPRKRNKRK